MNTTKLHRVGAFALDIQSYCQSMIGGSNHEDSVPSSEDDWISRVVDMGIPTGVTKKLTWPMAKL